MSQIVNGKKYSTTNATEICSVANSRPGDFRYYYETLWVTAKGNFFLKGEGGPQSKYSRSTGLNSWSSGSGIIPLNAEEVLSWAERHNISSHRIEDHLKIEEA